jgi:transposase-like protein
MTKEELRNKWETRISDFKSSGQTQSKWCAAHDLNIHQLRYWLKKFSSDESTNSRSSRDSKWLPIDVDDQVGETTNLLVKVGEVTIEVKPGYDPILFLDVVRKLKSLC